jgi:hypothetical protein
VHKRGWIQKRPTVVTIIRREGTKRLWGGDKKLCMGSPEEVPAAATGGPS